MYLRTHHVMMDGWALNEFSRQVFADYAHMADHGVPANGPRQSYLEFLEEDQRYRASTAHESDRTFFQRELTDVEPALFARTVPTGERRFGRTTFVLDGGLVERMLAAGASPFAYIAGVFATYLTRVHRSAEVVLGVPMLNRPSATARETLGQFANTLPLRVRIDGRSMTDLAAAVRTSTKALQEHEKLALGDVLRALPQSGAQARTLFDVTISYVRFPRPTRIPGVERDTVIMSRGHDQDTLSVVVRAFEDVSEVAVDLEYALDVFDEDFPADAVGGHIRTLIEQALDHPDRLVDTLPVLTEGDRPDVAGPRVEFPDATLHDLIAARAARAPHRIAVVGDAVTYAELDRRADQVAGVLHAAGVRPGDRVAVLLERGPHLLPALLGTLKAGGAYVPVDPGYPKARVEFLLADSRAKVVLVDPMTEAPGVPADQVIRMDDLPKAGADLPAVSPRDLAYVIYTSGSTGSPKGVMVEHRSVVNRLAWMQRRYPIGPNDVILQKTPTSFDVSVWELFWWAIEGARVALLPPGGEKDPREILRTIMSAGVTVLHFVPSMLGPFLDLLEQSPDLVEAASGLRLVFCSGEALPPARVEQFNRVFAADPPQLVNLYGPTEATVDVSYYDCPSAGPVRRVPIGRPIDNTELHILSAAGQRQPVGVAGELCVGGVGVARGYLDRPELTAEKFVDDPFTPGGRLYRAGDLARLLADGEIEYLGRIDGQVKIRGNRVELGEVQNRLAAVPEVRDAIVIDRESAARGTYLVGYYVADTEIEYPVLRGLLAESLPEFMIPAHFLRIDRIPLTPNGKADRRALPRTVSSAIEADTARTETEAVLAAVWAEVLDVASVGIHDNYFVLGGDSLLMLRIRAESEKRGIHFSLTDVIQRPTVAELAAVAVLGPEHHTADSVAPFELTSAVDRARLTGVQDAFPVTRLQLGLLFHSREHEDSAMYKDVFQYTLEIPWREAEFRRAFGKVVDRHPVLRSSFDLAGNSEPLQVIHDRAPGALDVVDLRPMSRADAEAKIRAHIRERRFHRYDFTQAPLYHLRAHVRADAIDLVLSFHHAILDGGSVANLLRELLQDYGHDIGLPVAPVPAHALPSPANHVREELRALDSDADRDHWKRTLDGVTLPSLDGFRSYEAPSAPEQIVHRVEVPTELRDTVRRFARAQELPVKSVLFAAYCLTMRARFGADDFVTGLITHGRPEQRDAERIVGLFLNTMPVRVTAGPTWLDTVRGLFAQEQDSHPHRRYPLSAIQADQGGELQVESAFNYVHFHVLSTMLRLPRVRLTDFKTWEETNFKILVNAIVDPTDGGIELRLDYDGRTFTPSQAEDFGATYIQVLARLAGDPHGTVDFGFLVAEPAIVANPAREERDVVQLFAEQVARTPDATALVFDAVEWTYAELDAVAERVAGHLMAAGTKTGDRVGIAMDRSPELIAVVLGVAKAGAACVPLDAGYPVARLTAMLERARPVRVIAHRAHAQLVADPAVLLDAETVTAEEPEGTDARRPISLDQTAYLLFTSGSTGEPKGVAMPHRSPANLVAWQNRVPSGAVGGRTLQFAPLSFDVSFQEIFATLCGGGSLLLVSEATRRDMPALLRLLDTAAVERVFLPYVALQQLAETSTALKLVPRALRVVISSGEQLRVTEEIRGLCSALPGVILENQYGPTESHVVTSFSMTGDPARHPALPPIGKPIDGAEVLLLDERGRPVPQGVKGEIHLGGACLAEGYFGRPELTAERFVPHPSAEGSVLYGTGDLGLALPSGDIVCVGRADSQVKVRGFRVEPAEVELAIIGLGLAGIRDAAVVPRRRDGIDNFLAAFLVGDPAAVDLDAVRARLRETLPEYLVPTHFQWLEAMPLTPSGKRDDGTLRRMPITAAVAADTTAPRDDLERALAEILADLLKVPIVGVHDNIFELGASSLTAMRLVVLIEQRYGVAIALSGFIAAPTVAKLA